MVIHKVACWVGCFFVLIDVRGGRDCVVQELEKHGLYLQPMKSDQVLAVLRGVKPPTTTASSA